MRVQIDQGWHDLACYSRPPAAKISHKRISDSSSRNAARLLTQGVPFSCLICKQMLTYVCVSVCVFFYCRCICFCFCLLVFYAILFLSHLRAANVDAWWYFAPCCLPPISKSNCARSLHIIVSSL